MFGSIGGTEILIILVIALVVFGPKRLPELGRTIGKGLGEFRRASNDLKRSLEDEITLDERRNEPTESPDTD
jgi:TatA/E family protein of Tat protein translocase